MQEYKRYINYKKLIENNKRSGEITIFISLICVVLCGFILIIIKSARVSAVRNRIEMITDISLTSIFSEYNKDLFDVYGLLYIDSSYRGVCKGNEESVKNHFARYFDTNISERDERLYGLKYISSEITDEVLASDNEYESLYRQLRSIPYYSDYSDNEIEEVIFQIEKDMREESNSEFDFDNQIESLTVTVYVEDFSGKMYECKRSYSLF